MTPTTAQHLANVAWRLQIQLVRAKCSQHRRPPSFAAVPVQPAVCSLIGVGEHRWSRREKEWQGEALFVPSTSRGAGRLLYNIGLNWRVRLCSQNGDSRHHEPQPASHATQIEYTLAHGVCVQQGWRKAVQEAGCIAVYAAARRTLGPCTCRG